jgi:predicted permease
MFRALRDWRFQTLVACTLATGVGVCAAMAGLVDLLLVREPAAVTSPRDLVSVELPRGTYAEYLDVRSGATALEMAAYRRSPTTLRKGAEVWSGSVECVSAEYFEVLGTRAHVGRASFVAGASSDDAAVVLSHRAWVRLFSGDSNVLGQALAIGPRQYTIIGVAPRSFAGLNFEPVDAWIPLAAGLEVCAPHRQVSEAKVRAIGRLGPTATFEQAQNQVRASLPRERQPDRLLRSLQETRLIYLGRDARTARWASGAAFLFLLVCCVNTSGLLGLGILERRSEFALRRYLGASDTHIVRRVAQDHIPLVVVVLAASTVVSFVVAALVGRYLPFAYEQPLVSMRMLVLLGVVAATAVMVTLVSTAWRSLRVDMMTELRGLQPSGTRRSRSRVALLVVQSASAFMLLVGALLLAKSVTNLWERAGYDVDRLISVSVDSSNMSYRSSTEIEALFEAWLHRVQGLSGIEDAALSSGDLLGASRSTVAIPVLVSPGVVARTDRLELPILHSVSPSYFSTVGTRILRGRAFSTSDNSTSGLVMILDENLARATFAEKEPLGQCLYLRQTPECVQVVGVSEPRRHLSLSSRQVEIFLSLAQASRYSLGTVPRILLARSESPAAMKTAIAGIVRMQHPDSPQPTVQLLADLAGEQARSWRLGARVFSLFGIAALLLGSIGLYSMLSFSVRLRRSEIGVRMALGASRGKILVDVLRQAFLVVVAGIALGVCGIYIAARYAEALLFEVAPLDPGALGVSALALSIAGLLGALVPGWRAASTCPSIVLRANT